MIKDTGYLTRTWYPNCHAAEFCDDIITEFTHTEWLGPTVFEQEAADTESIGYVDFVTRSSEQDRTGVIAERSRFLKGNGQRYYIDGAHPQIGWDGTCLCGSGKEFRKCYG